MRLLLALIACALLAACAHTTARFTGQPRLDAVKGPVFVEVVPGPALPPDGAHFQKRLLDICANETRKRNSLPAMKPGLHALLWTAAHGFY